MKTNLALFALLSGLAGACHSDAHVLVSTNSVWRYWEGTAEPSYPTNAWREPGFDDSGWSVGPAPFHYGTNACSGDDTLMDGTILPGMRGGYTTLYLRQEFFIEDLKPLAGLRLNVWFDDGLAMWLNGEPLRSPITVSGLSHTNQATANREASRTVLVLDSAMGLLRNGVNILCLQGFNVSLTNDDFRLEAELTGAPPVVSMAWATESVSEAGPAIVLRVKRAGYLEVGQTVAFATADGSALAGVDYVATNGTLSFAEGQTTQTVVVPILNDGIREAAEFFQVRLSQPDGGGVLGIPEATTVQIDDNDPGFQMEFGNYYVPENSGPLVVAVRRGNDGDFPASVQFRTVDAGAVAGSDYVATNGTLEFAAGESVRLVPVAILNDGVAEAREPFLFSLENPTATVGLGGQYRAMCTILESDTGVRFEQTSLAVHEFEGGVRLTVLRGNDGELGPFTVQFATSNVIAVAGVDYEATNGVLSFAANQMSQSFTVRIRDDDVVEPDRSFKVFLSGLSGPEALALSSTQSVANVTVCEDAGRVAHGLGDPVVFRDRRVEVTLTGNVASRFSPFLDIYPVEVSANLENWKPSCTLARTNSALAPLAYVDPQPPLDPMRFYRVVRTNLVTPFLPPTGPYAVGREDRMVIDPARRNRFGDSTNGALGVSIWYPATGGEGQLPLTLDESPRVEDPGCWPQWLDRSRWMFTYAKRGLELPAGLPPCPIVLQSHGVTGVRTDLQSLAEDLASHGFVVVATDHYDSRWPLYPDGRYLPGSDARENHSIEGVVDRVADLVFLLDQLEVWNRNDPFFAGHLDLERVGAVGFSWGGPTVGEFCRIDERCDVAVSLDGGWWENAPTLGVRGLQKPSLMMGRTDNAAEQLFKNAASDAFWLQVSDAAHQDFIDSSWWPDPYRLASGLEVSRTVHAYQRSFLNKYLNGVDDHLLDGAPGSAFPRVATFKKK